MRPTFQRLKLAREQRVEAAERAVEGEVTGTANQHVFALLAAEVARAAVAAAEEGAYVHVGGLLAMTRRISEAQNRTRPGKLSSWAHRTVTVAASIVLLVACQEPAGPAFDVDVEVQTVTRRSGCGVQWTARATDSTVAVNWRVGSRVSDTYTSWMTGGMMFGYASQSWDWNGEIALHWQFKAPGFAEDKWVSVSCGSSWREP